MFFTSWFLLHTQAYLLKISLLEKITYQISKEKKNENLGHPPLMPCLHSINKSLVKFSSKSSAGHWWKCCPSRCRLLCSATWWQQHGWWWARTTKQRQSHLPTWCYPITEPDIQWSPTYIFPSEPQWSNCSFGDRSKHPILCRNNLCFIDCLEAWDQWWYSKSIFCDNWWS